MSPCKLVIRSTFISTLPVNHLAVVSFNPSGASTKKARARVLGKKEQTSGVGGGGGGGGEGVGKESLLRRLISITLCSRQSVRFTEMSVL